MTRSTWTSGRTAALELPSRGSYVEPSAAWTAECASNAGETQGERVAEPLPNEGARSDVAGGAHLVEACLRGEAQAWERFVERYVPLIRAVARRTLRMHPLALQKEDLDDIVENTLFAFIRDGARLLARYDERFALSTYVGVVARTQARRYARRKRHARAALDPSDLPAAEQCPVERLAAGDRRRAIEASLAELSPRDRAVLILFYFEQSDYREIAEALGVSVNSVGAALHRARSRLRRRLEACGFK